MHNLYRLGFGAQLSSGNQWVPWIHIDDIIGSICHCIKNKELNGIFNLTGPQAEQQKGIHNYYKSFYGAQVPTAAPGFIIKSLYGEVSQVILGSHKVLPKDF